MTSFVHRVGHVNSINLSIATGNGSNYYRRSPVLGIVGSVSFVNGVLSVAGRSFTRTSSHSGGCWSSLGCATQPSSSPTTAASTSGFMVSNSSNFGWHHKNRQPIGLSAKSVSS